MHILWDCQEVIGYVEMFIFMLNLYLQPYIDNDCFFIC
jgi:hypothetical protein